MLKCVIFLFPHIMTQKLKIGETVTDGAQLEDVYEYESNETYPVEFQAVNEISDIENVGILSTSKNRRGG